MKRLTLSSGSRARAAMLLSLLGCSSTTTLAPDADSVSTGGVAGRAPSGNGSGGSGLVGSSSGGSGATGGAGLGMQSGGGTGVAAQGGTGATGGSATGATGGSEANPAGGRGSGGMSVAAGGSSTTSAGGSPATAQAATWDNVKLVLTGTNPPCNSSICHNGNGKISLGFPVTNDAQLYTVLTQYVSKDCDNMVLVSPGHPESSALVKVLKGPCSKDVPQMPKGCIPDQGSCVPDDYIAAVEQWIAEGANRP